MVDLDEEFAPGLDPEWLQARLKGVRAPFWPSMWGWTRYMGRAMRTWV